MKNEIEKYSIVYYIQNTRVVFHFSSCSQKPYFQITKAQIKEIFIDKTFLKKLKGAMGLEDNCLYGLMKQLDDFFLREFKVKVSAMAFNHNA